MSTTDDLMRLKPRHDYLVGIDSDGCVFDTMGVKQREHFLPQIVRFWHLEPIAEQVRDAVVFTNLYSIWRGRNRFVNLLMTFELLAERDAMRTTGIPLPDTAPLRAYISSGVPLGNPSLATAVERTGDPELARTLDWSLAVNADISSKMRQVPPFPLARECIEYMHRHSDTIVVSQTPEEALVKEWRLHDLEGLVRVIAGQEIGTKTEHLRFAADKKYAPGRVLMIGDAPGDLLAAREAGAEFYPITPGAEASAWQRLHDEAFGRFLSGTYSGAYADHLIEAFMADLPSIPPWKS